MSKEGYSIGKNLIRLHWEKGCPARDDVGWSVGDMITIEVIQNERLIKLLGKKGLFIIGYIYFDHQYLWKDGWSWPGVSSHPCVFAATPRLA